MSVTNLACWTLGPAYHHSASTEQPNCLSCSAQVTEEQFCDGCGRGVCTTHTHRIDHIAYCSYCADDARKGRC
jgi:hypothetical protein